MMQLVRPGRVPQTNRGSVTVGAQQISTPITFPAPTEGLVTTQSMAAEVPGSATVLDNWIPTLTGVRIRGGSTRRGLAADGGDFLSAFRYKYGTNEKLFMATASAIYDMTSPAAPPATTAAAVSGMANGDWTTFQHTNAGNAFLVAVNGANERRLYNGSAWTTTPAITFTDGSTSAQFGYGFLFKNRQFFLKNATLDAYYLGLNAIGGAAAVFPLGGVMKKGGSLLTGFTWSLESGDGLADYCVFVSTEGEVAIYSGSDPSSASDFALKGVYQIGKPLGKNAWMRAGGDILVATIDGLIPISQVFQRDRQTITLVSLSRQIEDDWKKAANATATGWNMALWPEQNIVFITFPENTVVSDTTFVLNVLNGKWGIIRNWMANCFQTYQSSIFFGSIDGVCWQGDITGEDDGQPFPASYLSQFTAGGQIGQRKSVSLARLFLRAKTKPHVRLFARADHNLSTPNFGMASVGDDGSSEWDIGLWDVAEWDTGTSRERFEFRQNVRASGDMIALGCQIVSGGQFKLDIELDLMTAQVQMGEQSA